MMIQMRYKLHLTAKHTIFNFNKVIELILSYFFTSVGPSWVTDTWIIIRLYQILREKPQCLPFPWPSMCVYLCSRTYQIMTHILPNPFVFGYLGTNIQRSAQQDLTTRTGTEKNLQMLLPKELSNPPLKERGFDVILLPYILSWHTYNRHEFWSLL